MSAEGGNLDSLLMGTASEGKEMSAEEFREQMAQARAAKQQLQKEEGKARAADNNLAAIIMAFLKKHSNTDLFLLISRCVSLDIPSELILAVLSLVDEKANAEVTAFLEAAENAEASTGTLVTSEQAKFEALPPAIKKAVDAWVTHIQAVALAKPHRTHATITQQTGPETREVAAPLVQLSAFIMRMFLEKAGKNIDFAQIRDFMQTVYVSLATQVQELMQGQKRIA